jgi:cellulose synthase/poly-beta-1,6-N-acetylglucosamine synthase-like glycosyltransferase
VSIADRSPDTLPLLACSVGIMAYNEEANIGRVLAALLDQQMDTCCIDSITVLASGCTDNTETIVREWSARDPRIRLIIQPERLGKASAVNLFLRHTETDIIVLVSADTVPDRGTIQQLVAPFADPDVGMTGGHPVPVNDPSVFMGFIVHLLWETHHQIALFHPKMGELIAFRRIFYRIPRYSAVDEANMEPLIRGQGYHLRYVPEAIVYNRGPETVRDFLKQRRRIYAGHLRLREEQGYAVATMSIGNVLIALRRSVRLEPRFFMWAPAAILLEAYGRFLGWVDYRLKKRDHVIWDVAVSTKGPIK